MACRHLIRSFTRASETRLAPAFAPLAPQTSAPCPLLRSASKFAKPSLKKQPTVFNDPEKPLDEAIRAVKVNFVDAQSRLHSGQHLNSLLRQIDRQTQHVRQVSIDGNGTPIVKIFTHAELREQQDIRTILSKQKDNDATKKELELSWAIDKDNDLAYRLRKIEAWLAEGRDVDVIIAPKKGGRRASRDESQHLVDILRTTTANVAGATEVQMDGSLGAQAILHFKGVATDADVSANKRETLRQQRSGKKAEKERTRADWKAELEARAQRKAERERRTQGPQIGGEMNVMHS